MLRVSRLTDYGTLIMSQMARYPTRVHSASDLAVTLGLGLPTVSKVLKGLARRELVAGVRGLRGGYSLTRAPEQISIAEIVDALEERPFGLTECSALSGLCDIEDACRVRANWRSINDIVRRALESVSLAEMAGPPQEWAIDIASIRRPRSRPASPQSLPGAPVSAATMPAAAATREDPAVRTTEPR